MLPRKRLAGRDENGKGSDLPAARETWHLLLLPSRPPSVPGPCTSVPSPLTRRGQDPESPNKPVLEPDSNALSLKSSPHIALRAADISLITRKGAG